MACSGGVGDRRDQRDPGPVLVGRRAAHVHEVRVDVGGHVGRRIEQRVQFEHPQRALRSAGELERPVDAFGRDARDADQLLGADRLRERRVVLARASRPRA